MISWNARCAGMFGCRSPGPTTPTTRSIASFGRIYSFMQRTPSRPLLERAEQRLETCLNHDFSHDQVPDDLQEDGGAHHDVADCRGGFDVLHQSRTT